MIGFLGFEKAQKGSDDRIFLMNSKISLTEYFSEQFYV
jgi:hypothetical protein